MISRAVVWMLVFGIAAGTAVSVYFFLQSDHLYDQPTIARANLAELGRALAVYEKENGTLPPAILADKDGMPLQSWRVLLLPYLPDDDSRRLARQYRMDEPWDSEFNAKLTSDRMPLVYYAKPPDPRKVTGDVERGMTRFVAVTGEGTLWPSDRGASTSQSKRRLLLVEYFGEDIPWTEPRDIPVSVLDDDATLMELGLADAVSGPGQALYSDGSVECLPKNASPRDLRRLARGE